MSFLLAEVIAAAGLPETFDFFARLAETVKEPKQRDEVACGLKAAGGDKALPVLLQMLERAQPTSDKDSYGDGLVRVLVEMDKPEATPKLAELAAAGNLRAAQVLAGSKNDSVRMPLTELASRRTVRSYAPHSTRSRTAGLTRMSMCSPRRSRKPMHK